MAKITRHGGPSIAGVTPTRPPKLTPEPELEAPPIEDPAVEHEGPGVGEAPAAVEAVPDDADRDLAADEPAADAQPAKATRTTRKSRR